MGTRRLILLRHGDAESVDGWPEDFERPLTRRGSAEAREMAKRLVRRELIPALIIASPAERAWNTASLVAEICEIDAQQIRCERELYLASAEGMWQVVRRQPSASECILVVGHNPSISELASRFGSKSDARTLPPAGFITAVWHTGSWDTLSPRAAVEVESDDPESMPDIWS
jgi:phosphohistidine phosphatase